MLIRGSSRVVARVEAEWWYFRGLQEGGRCKRKGSMLTGGGRCCGVWSIGRKSQPRDVRRDAAASFGDICTSRFRTNGVENSTGFGKNDVFTGSSSENAKSKLNWKFRARQANSIRVQTRYDPIRKRNAEPDEDEDNKYGTDFC